MVEFDWFSCLNMKNNRATVARTGSHNNNALTRSVHKATGERVQVHFLYKFVTRAETNDV